LRAFQHLLAHFGQTFGRGVNQNAFDHAACYRRAGSGQSPNKQQVRRSFKRSLTQSSQGRIRDIDLFTLSRFDLLFLAQDVATKQNRSRHTQRGQGGTNHRSASKCTKTSASNGASDNRKLFADQFTRIGKCGPKPANVPEI